ncbi:MAG: PD-(D/E)XK nuclease family protein [Gammaproteobacteria bacterium]|nr:PD-(D/E)XK nuclease family protein [Gammaproteobacteria bacterium]MDH3467691.1 PD-(D/E)XK nuclease family protein [Gammaproteobacteria bacterium]
MSTNYNVPRSRYLYAPGHAKPFALSRSKIDLFVECPRCFYLDRRLGIGRPPGYPFNLNIAVDTLLKAEFDVHRAAHTQHPLLEQYGVDARPVAHDSLDIWRQNFKGVRILHARTNLEVFGAIDDLWQNPHGEYIVVDYKATSKRARITALDQDWHAGYKRQMEVYQWLLRRNGLAVSNIGYFVYANGIADKQAFDGKLEFDVTLIPYEGNDDWVEAVLDAIHACLNGDDIPNAGEHCDYCPYRRAVTDAESRN